MRTLLLLAALTGCPNDPAITPDASTDPDASLTGNGTATWPCYFWPDGETKCAPKCSNKTLLGREVFGEHNTCETAVGECPRENMTGPAESGGGCCVVVGAEVDYYGCQ